MKLIFLEDYGSFNYADPEQKETYWKLLIKDNKGKTLQEDGVDCVLEWREEGDEQGRWTMRDELTAMARESFVYGNKFWVSTTDYKARTIAFIKAYNKSKTQLVEQYETDRKARISKEIEALTRELEQNEIDDEDIDFNSVVEKEVKKYESWIKTSEEELSQYKEGTPLYDKELEKIESYKAKLAKLT